jgi:N-acetylmuramoyl-L-alanine amidase
LQHLPFGTEIIAIGEERGFYRVKLGRDGFGFISKDSAQKSDSSSMSYANIQYTTHKSNKDEKLIEISLDKKVPYTVSDNNSGLDIVLYNIDNHLYEKYEDHIEGKPFGYASYYNNDGTLVISMKNFPKVNPQYPLKNIKITIDSGHGGSENGAIGCLGDKEKDINFEIAKNLRSKLEKAGAKVLMTREDDSDVGLNERVEKSNYFDADIFLSIHNNALPDSAADRDATGTETYYFYPQSKELANILAKSVADKTGFKNGGARGKSLAVVRNTQSIAVLLEVGYMINPDDNSKLINKDFQNKITDGIIDGLERYLRQDDI